VIADPQGSAAYKRQLVRVYVRRAIEKALAS
jgi:CO/xanthine dehydrogenase FAD-binding subunit